MRFAKTFVSSGEIELMSTTVLPFDRPAATPSSPNSTASTSGVSGTIRKTMSACLATSAAVAQRVAPAEAIGLGHVAAA